jgi:hypothetical protein
VTQAAALARRLASYRAWQRHADGLRQPTPADPARAAELATRIAVAIDGVIVETSAGRYVRRDGAPITMPVDRAALGSLPGLPAPDVPLVCLDTETTGLGTAAGTYVFLVGLAVWVGDRLEPIQLLLPDQSEEAAFLDALGDLIPADAWLVTYNGRGFDWPLLDARYRMGRRAAPQHGGHLDLLPLVRRLFRHRMTDARLVTVETELLAIRRHHDVGGWEIPGRYLSFLRDGSAHHLVDVVVHNATDVISLARLLHHVADHLGRRDRWPDAPAGDLAGLARLLRRDGRVLDALACLDVALAGVGSDRKDRPRPVAPPPEEPWWSPRVAATYGGPRSRHHPWPIGAAFAAPWEEPRLLVERARLLRRLGRIEDAREAWRSIAPTGGPTGAAAWIEIAKIHEHVDRDPVAALEASVRARVMLNRSRAIGRPVPRLEREVAHRIGRLRRRIAIARRRAA